MSIEMGLEPENFNLRTGRAVTAEGIATGVFVFVGCGSVVAMTSGARLGLEAVALPGPATITGIALAHGLAIALLVAATARISGGHINPAVTFAAMLTGKIKVSTAALYVGAQLIGAVLGVLLLKAIVAGPVEQGLGAHSFTAYDLAADQIGLLDDQVGDGAGAALLMEMALTFMLVFTVFATAMDPKGMGNLAPIAIGLAVVVGHLAGVSFTGASMNPARSFGPAVVAGEWDDQWLYWLGPLIGGAIAGLLYEFVFLVRDDEEALTAPSPPRTD
jgi:aquaporin TIP